MVRNIIATYRRATPEQIRAGHEWYRVAQEFCATLALGTDYSYRQVAGVIAALSPQSSWAQNQENARVAVYVHGLAGDVNGISLHTSVQMDKVGRILDGETPESVLRGPKESAFCRNIQGDYTLVTVDRWAFKTATGVALPDVNPGTGKALGGVGKGAYRRIHAAYVEAAHILGIAPAILQAIVWVVERGSAV